MKSKKKPTKNDAAEASALAPDLTNAHTRWEYIVEFGKKGALPFGRLNELGKEGWELCATVSTPDTPSDFTSGWPAVVQFYFKRPLCITT